MKNIKYKNLANIILISIFLVASVAGTTITISGQNILDIISKEDLNLDTNLIVDSENYGQPQSILVAPIFKESETNLDYSEWYKGIFYYLSSDRFNFKDIPAHYLIDKDGNIYEGIEGGSEKRVLVEGEVNSPVVIFYLAERGDSDFSSASLENLEALTQSIANQNEIDPANLFLSRINLEINESTQEVNLVQEEIFGSWKVTFNDINERIARNYDPSEKSYEAEIAEFSNPGNSVQANQEIVLQIQVKNTGDNTIFSGTESELILTKSDDEESQFFLTEQWLSPFEIKLMPSGEILKPDEEKTYEFRLKSPLEFGNLSENFELKTVGGQTFPDSQIEISLDIDRGNLQVLEITETETGTLNVRQQPTVSSPVEGIVSPGERFIWTESNQSGWYKIEFNDKTGWVLNRYVNII
jgi:uncharacterized protein YgiM (DUF1202 family)